MRCRNCDYPLWNLRGRSCPECGEPFRPGEYEFVPHSVRFCCPQCDQPYYGTSETGHLVPNAFDCVGCARAVHMDEMVLRPAEDVAEEQTSPKRMPWLERGTGTRFSAFASTIGLSLIRPRRLMASVPLDSSLLQAGWFATLCAFVISLLSILPLIGMMGVSLFATGPGNSPARAVGVLGGTIVASMVFAVLFTALYIVLWIACTHGLLLITGQRAGGLRRTMQAILYSSGANIVTAVPCLGLYVGWIWWVVSAVLMVYEGQRVHAVRAAVAVCVFPVLLTIGIVGLYMGLIVAGISAGRPAMTTASAQVDVVRQQLVSAATVDAEYPAHGLQLVLDGALQPGDLLAHEWLTTRADVSFGAFTLEEFTRQGPARRAEMAASVIDGQSEDLVAHRIGDFVFTYHGVDPAGAPDLWLVLLAPDPTVNPSAVTAGWTVATSAATTTIPTGGSATALRTQNALRARAGLPPLIDPAWITSDAPQIAERE